MKRRTNIALFLVFVGGFALESAGQTIADAARRERARQSNITVKGVYTNAGLITPSTVTPYPVQMPQAVPGGPPPEASTAPPPEQPAGPTDNKGRDEKWWRNAFADARAALTRAENKATLAQLKINQLNSELLINSFMFNRENRIGAAMTVAKAELESAQKEVEAAKQKIADLEDELRRSNGLPGWAR